jgi:homoserine O-succinyltransferase/O-acetyltransferase
MNFLRIAILDMYDGRPNQGMRCLRELIAAFAKGRRQTVDVVEFEVRGRREVPDTGFDIYISSGGPGSPLESEGSDWEAAYFGWLREMENWNNQSEPAPKKFIFFICHSFQLVCRHYQLAEVCSRKSTAFGVFPVHLLEGSRDEPVFAQMPDPFYAVDSRDFQVIRPDGDVLEEKGATLLCIEKERPHVPYERAIMGIRFSPYWIGTQFHPEADAVGMHQYLQMEDKKQAVIAEHGEEKWKSMTEQLEDPDKIMWTYAHLLPNFLHLAAGPPVASKRQIL